MNHLTVEPLNRLAVAASLVAAALSAAADGFQTVKITDVESAVAKYVAATNPAGASCETGMSLAAKGFFAGSASGSFVTQHSATARGHEPMSIPRWM